jgi:hypothetical protein
MIIMNKELIIYSNTSFYSTVLHYLYTKYNDKINRFEYISENTIKPYEFVKRGEKTRIKVCHPCDCEFSFIFEDHEITFTLLTIHKQNKDTKTMIRPYGGCGGSQIEEIIYKQIKLTSETNELLIKFVDITKEFRDEQIEKSNKSDNQLIDINIWKKDFWTLICKNPKRPLKTLYLQEGIKESLIEKITEFFDPQTRDDYISYGIPYKSVYMLYGVPGSGKTSTINTIASHFNCDIFSIPISKELTDYMLIDAISYIESKDNKKRIIVIEDIDSIFTDRKKGDDENQISLQGILNCLDGFTCVEGTLLFITANHPEFLDSAILRSCRVDHKIELGYADEYQTRNIFCNLLPNESKNFKKFYKLIRNREYTTAMLQEFLFFNRKCDDIYSKIDLFYKIIEDNNKNYSKQNKELYL